MEVLNLSFGRFDGNPVCLIVVLWRWFSSFFGGIFLYPFWLWISISSNRTREKGNKGMVLLNREREKRMLWGVKTFLMHLNGVCRLRSAALVWDFKGKDIELWPFFKNVIIALLFEAVILKCRYKGYYWSVDRWYLSSQVCIFEKCRD